MRIILPVAFLEWGQLEIKISQRTILDDVDFAPLIAIKKSTRHMCPQPVAARGERRKTVKAARVTHRGRNGQALLAVKQDPDWDNFPGTTVHRPEKLAPVPPGCMSELNHQRMISGLKFKPFGFFPLSQNWT